METTKRGMIAAPTVFDSTQSHAVWRGVVSEAERRERGDRFEIKESSDTAEQNCYNSQKNAYNQEYSCYYPRRHIDYLRKTCQSCCWYKCCQFFFGFLAIFCCDEILIQQ